MSYDVSVLMESRQQRFAHAGLRVFSFLYEAVPSLCLCASAVNIVLGSRIHLAIKR
jgi:hypothetical protein